MSQEAAETIALNALAWLAGHDDLLPVFLGATGSDMADLRRSAGDPVFLAAVLDFVLMDDAWVLEFTRQAGIPPDTVSQARAGLPGGAQVNWT